MVYTHCIQPPPAQRPLSRGRCVSTISLQVPSYISSTKLWKHLRYLIDLGGVYPYRSTSWVCSRARRCRFAKVPSYSKEADDKKNDDLRYVDGLFCHVGALRVDVGGEVIREVGPRYDVGLYFVA
jgi:hypothetical protein